MPISAHPVQLTDEELAIWEWQLDIPGFSEEGQLRLRNSTVLVTRIGGLGGPVAQQLCAAGVGRIVLAHAGNLKSSDLNRQVLMHYAGLGQSRVEQAAARLRAFNPLVEVVPIAENISPENASRLLEGVDLAVDAAPLFSERMALQEAAWPRGIPIVEAAMFSMEAQLTVCIPGQTPCLRCLYPVDPPHWKRRFPVFGAVSASIGSMAAMEAIKLLAGFGEVLAGKMLRIDLADHRIQKLELQARADCPLCGTKAAKVRRETHISG